MDPVFSIPVISIFLFFLAVVSFFFSISETAIIALSKIRLRHMVIRRMRGAESIHRLVTKLDKFIVAILVGNNFVNIAMSTIVTAIAVRAFGYNWGLIAATFISTFFILVFCEIIPKILATKHTEKIALLVSPSMGVFINIFNPVIHIFTGFSNFILRLLRITPPKRSPLISEEELRLMIEIGREEGVLSDEERRMLYRIFEFGDVKVNDVMVPKDKIVAVDINSHPEDLLDIFVEQGHARLPVYETGIDDIIGIVYARDLLYILRDKELFVLQDLVHPPYCVAPSLKVNELLRRFQAEKIQIAIVVNEKKQTLGLVTLEDLIEEIVGEIEEEYTRNKN